MGVLVKFILVTSAILFGYKLNTLWQTPPVPQLDDTFWGPGDPAKEETKIKPFHIEVPKSVLKDLQYRLQNARPLVQPLDNVHHNYGLNTNLLTKIVNFWKTDYNWTQREQFLNQYPQFTVSVQGLRLHYIHVKPENPGNRKVLPLLLLHGWPGSVREFYELIPFLTKSNSNYDFVFEVIVPSLPGYGFSEAAVKPGLGAVQMAVVFKNFMNRLGFDQYYLQGGDWGAFIVQHMATLYPEKVLGVHSNMCTSNTRFSQLKTFIGSLCPSLFVEPEHQHKVYPLSDFYLRIILETGYLHLQATKPDTVGVSLNDSPVGLASYIIEKFITWTNSEWKDLDDGGLTKKFTYTKLLDNIMIYWVSNSITTSMRLYAETMNLSQFDLDMDRIPVHVPSACARFPHELAYSPTAMLKDKYYNLVQVTDLEDGGHFAAFELPNVLAEDIFSGVKKMISSQRSTP